MRRVTRCLIILVILFLFFTAVLGLAFRPFISDLQNPEYRERFAAWAAEHGYKGVLVLFGIQVLQIVVAVIPGGPVQVIAGAAYGAWGGLLVIEAGCAAATALVFFLVRKFGLPLVIRFFGADVLNTWGFLKDEKKTALITFILFLVPGIPKDTLTYLAPLSSLSLIRFTLISVFARFPAVLSSTLMGSAVIRGNWIIFFLLFAFTAVSGILGIQFRDRIIHWFKARGKDRL